MTAAAAIISERKRGVGLIETAMGLGIAALIVAAALAYFSNANESSKVRDVLGQAMAIHVAVHALYGAQTDMGDLTTSVVARSGQLPRKYITTDGLGLTNAYRGPVYVYGAVGFPAFDMLFLNLSRTACQQVALGGFQMGSILVQMVVNPSPGIPSAGGFGSYGLSPAAWRAGVVANCNRNANTIRFSTTS